MVDRITCRTFKLPRNVLLMKGHIRKIQCHATLARLTVKERCCALLISRDRSMKKVEYIGLIKT